MSAVKKEIEHIDFNGRHKLCRSKEDLNRWTLAIRDPEENSLDWNSDLGRSETEVFDLGTLDLRLETNGFLTAVNFRTQLTIAV